MRRTARHGRCLASLAAVLCALSLPAEGAEKELWLEAESFSNQGGWLIDQQSIDQMGSAYIMAHGIGVPVGGLLNQPPYPELGRIVREISPIAGRPGILPTSYYEDVRKENILQTAQRCKPALNTRVIGVEPDKSVPNKIAAYIARNIDLHFPDPIHAELFDEPFRSCANHRNILKPYPVPYRCLYSKDVPNLFLAGRHISVSHIAFAPTRVMRTLGVLGEVVDMAASICRRHNACPRDVYESHLDELKSMMTRVCESVSRHLDWST